MIHSRTLASTLVVLLFCGAVPALGQTTGSQQAQPPLLLFPYNQSDVTERFVVWSWFMQSTTVSGKEVVCDLHVVEVLDQQTPEEALRNNPLVLEKRDLRATIWQANAGTRSFLPGRRYAWRIIAHVGPTVVSESEIWTFTFAEPTESPAPASAETAPVPMDSLARRDSLQTRDSTGMSLAPLPTQSSQSPVSASTAGGASGRKAGISLSGTMRLTAQSTNIPGELSQTPEDFMRVELDPTITINGAPLQLSFLLTTERQTSETSINRGAFGYQRRAGGLSLDIQQRIGERGEDSVRSRFDLLRDSLLFFRQDTAGFNRQLEELRALQNRSPEEIAKQAEALPSQSAAEGILLDIPAFGFGAVAPRFGTLFLNAVTMNGGFMEYNPGNFYVAGALGKVERQIEQGSGSPGSGSPAAQTAPKFFKNLYAARIGYGKKEAGNLIVSLMYSRDDQQSELLESLLDSARASFAPQENFVLGLSGQDQLEDLGLTLSGELNVSLFTERVQGRLPQQTRLRSLVTKLFGRNNVQEESIGDLAYTARASKLLFDRHARASVEVHMVGPDYRSAGTVGLRTDVFGYDVKYDHEILDNFLLVGGTYSLEKTGFILEEPSSSRLQKFGMSIEVRPRRLPSLQLGFSSNTQEQKNPGEESFKKALVRVASAASRYVALLGSVRMLNVLSMVLQKGESDDRISTFTSSSLNLSTQVSFPSSLTAILSVSHTKTTALADTSQGAAVLAGSFSLTHEAFEVWQNTLGVTLSGNRLQKSRGVFFSSELRVGDTGSVEFRWEYTDFKNDIFRTQGSVDRIARLVAKLGFG